MKRLMILGMLLASSVSANAQSAGDWVLARWQNGDYWFPGVVNKVSGDRITVHYDDGDRETLYVSSVRPYNWAVGSRVECNFKGQGWYSGRITSLKGEKLSIAYDDGDKENTRTGSCRSR